MKFHPCSVHAHVCGLLSFEVTKANQSDIKIFEWSLNIYNLDIYVPILMSPMNITDSLMFSLYRCCHFGEDFMIFSSVYE